MPTARFANEGHSDVAYDPGDGAALIAMKPDDPRLEGVEIAAYERPPVTPPSLDDLMRQMQALQAQLAAAMAAQQG